MRIRPGGADVPRRPLRGGMSIVVTDQRLPPLATDVGPYRGEMRKFKSASLPLPKLIFQYML